MSAQLGLPGTTVDAGRPFVLYTALADQAGRQAIAQYFQPAPYLQPLDPLPAGIELISQVHVVRA